MRTLFVCLALTATLACSGTSDDKNADTGAGADAAAEETRVTADVTPVEEVAATDVVAELPPELLPDLPPEGPQPPAPMPYSGGTCPTLVAGKNTLQIGGRTRSFELWIPPHPQDNDSAVVFVWHGNGDTAKNLGGYFLAATAPKEYNTFVVAPSYCCADNQEDCCDISMTWNMGTFSKPEADLALFDDILYCLDEQFDIDNKRVYTTGFSAGSLWSSYLVVHRSEYLASAVIFSGGTGLVFDYPTPVNKIPLLLSWGGPNDIYMGVVNFANMTTDFSTHLQEDEHFLVECNHNLGHTVPYGGPFWAYRFLFAHQWGDTESPFAAGLTEEFPDYCVVVD